ncbi:CHAT domain-containing protein [bacterium]|nr:MAG: CHAT domain-containing protein [bacterium]
MSYEATLHVSSDGPIQIALYGGPVPKRIEATLPLDDFRALVDRWHVLVSAHDDHGLAQESVRAFGSDFARSIFPSELREGLYRARHRCLQEGVRLRLRLVLSPSVDLLPFEAMHLGGDVGFFGLDAVLRPFRDFTAVPRPAEPETRLRVLLAYADPGTPRFPRLGWIGDEFQAIRTQLDGRHEVRIVNDAVPSVLEKAIREFRPHILHFSGHGEAKPTGHALILQGATPNSSLPLRGDDLGKWLAAAGTRLVVLSACDTYGIARELGVRGVPSVVAMQVPIRTSAPPALSRAFYAALVSGLPVDDAVSDARQVLRDRGGDWIAPTLYSAKPEPLARSLVSEPAVGAASRSRSAYRDRPIVGRSVERGRVRRALIDEGVRAVALTGTGGVGKSRLAREAASDLEANFPDGTFFIPCGEIADAEALAAIVRARVAPDSDAPPATFAYLQGKRVLLVLDGIDALVHAGVASFLERILEAADGTAIVSTSRLRPALPDVLEIPIRPLEECAELFHQTALAAQPYFDPTPEESEMVAEICRRVGGLPLAVVLAATRMRDMTVADLSEIVQEGSLRVLSGRREDEASEGLFQTIGSSVGRLNSEDARFLRNLAVFRSRFAVPDAAEISGLNRFDAIDALTRLRDHSLVEADLSGGQAKYSLLDPIREYLEETLPPGDEEGLRAQYAHAKLAADRAKKVRELVVARKWVESSDILWTHQADFRSAVAFADANELFPIVGSIADSLARTYFESGIWTELAALLGSARRAWKATDDRALASRLLGIQGALAALLDRRDECRELWHERARICADLGDSEGRADAYFDLAGSDFWNTSDEDVEVNLVKAEIASGESGKPELLASVYTFRATLAVRAKDKDKSLYWAEKAVSLSYAEGDSRQLFIDAYAAQAFSFAGDHVRGEAGFRNVLVGARRTESRLHIAIGLQGMATMYEAQGRVGLAARCLLAAAAYWRSIGSNRLGDVERESERLQELYPDAYKTAATSDTRLFGIADEIISGVC